MGINRFDIPQLICRERGGVLAGTQPHHVQQRCPRGGAGFHCCDKGIRPAGHHLGLAVAGVSVAGSMFRTVGSVRAQPVRHVHRQDDLVLAVGNGDFDHGRRPDLRPQCVEVNPAVIDRVVAGSVAPVGLGLRRAGGPGR